MKHLKRYKLFEGADLSTNDIKLDIDNILYDLTDVGFDATCSLWRIREIADTYHGPNVNPKNHKLLSFAILVAKSYDVPDGHGGFTSEVREEFKWSDIEEVMRRICDYLFTISSLVMFSYDENVDGESFAYKDWRCGRSEGLLSVLKKEFPKYYYKDEGWFRIELDVVT